MTDPNPSESSSAPSEAAIWLCRQRWRRVVVWGLGALAIGGTALTAGGTWWLQNRLAVVIERELTHFLNRPVEIGRLQLFTWGYLRFGESEILPTDRDPDRLQMAALEVNYDLLSYLLQRRLKVRVTAVDGSLKLEQGSQGEWLRTPLKPLSHDHPINLVQLQLRNVNAQITTRSASGLLRSPIDLQIGRARAKFDWDEGDIRYDLAGTIARTGEIALQGTGDFREPALSLTLWGDRIPALTVGRLIPLPIRLTGGTLDSRLQLHWQQGTAPRLEGTATLQHVSADLKQLPRPITHASGSIRLKGDRLELDSVRASYGKLGGVASGIIVPAKGFRLQATLPKTPIPRLLATLNLQAPVPLTGGVAGKLYLDGSFKNPILTADLVTPSPILVDRIPVRSLRTQLAFRGATLSVYHLAAQPEMGGTVTGTGEIQFKPRKAPYALNFQARSLPLSVARSYRSDLPLASLVKGRGELRGDLQKPQTLQVRATGQVDWENNPIAIEDFQLNGNRWQGELRFAGLDPSLLPLTLPEDIDLGRLQGRFQIGGDRRYLALDRLQAEGEAELTSARGTIRSSNLRLDGGQWQGQFQVRQWAIAPFIPELPRSLAKSTFDGLFDLGGELTSDLNHLRGMGAGQLTLPQGSISARNLNLDRGRWSGQFQTENLALSSFLPFARTRDRLDGQFNLAGQIDRPRETLTGKGSALLSLGQGSISIPRIDVGARQARAELKLDRVALSPIDRQLRGQASGQVQLTVPLAFKPERLQSKGTLLLSEGMGLINRPITADFVWNGRRLQLHSVKAEELTAKGWIDLVFRGRRPRAQSLNLTVDARNFPLQALVQTLPLKDAAGTVDFSGTFLGQPSQLQIDGKIALLDVRIPALPLTLESALKGKIATAPDGSIALNLAGKIDKISLTLDPRLQPFAADLQLTQLSLRGSRERDRFRLDVERLPLKLLQAIARANATRIPSSLHQPLLIQPIGGDLAGQIWLDLSQKILIAENFAVKNPQWGMVKGDRLTGKLDYRNGQLTLQETQFWQNNSLYQLNARGNLQNGQSQWQGKIAIAEGNIQDLLASLQIYEFEDLKRGLKPPIYAKAADLYPSPPPPDSPAPPLFAVGTPQGSLVDRLNNFSQHLATLNQQARESDNSALPPLSELQGQIEGNVQFAYAPATGLASQFALQGDRWHWGQAPPLQLAIRGSLEKGVLTFAPLTADWEKARIRFQGQLGGDRQQGQLDIANFPLQPLSEALASKGTVAFDGLLDGTLTLAGSRARPSARGQWTIERPSLNQAPLNPIQGHFIYSNSRFEFAARNPSAIREAFLLEGSFPLRLPLAVEPDSDRLDLRLILRDRELSLLNALLGGKVLWTAGKGELNLDITGRVNPETSQISGLKALGLAQIQQASLTTPLLPAPISEVQGKILFDFDRLQVESLTGKMNGGTIAIAGILPRERVELQTHTLHVQFGDLLLDIPGLYKGGARGKIEILGSIEDPQIGGRIDLFKGQVLLGNALKGIQSVGDFPFPLEFSNFDLVLGSGIQIAWLPILTFGAEGNLRLNGLVREPAGEGIIYLTGGQVNLFASQLRLVSGAENTAQFSPRWGLDPYLNLHLAAAVNEVNANTVRTNPLSSEINDPFTANNENLQTIRVQAQVTGLAGQLTEGAIELSSTPQRSRREIISLLGGGFVDTLGRGDTALGLANLANSAVFGTVQGALGEALGLGEFRIFPTPLIDERDRQRSEQIGVAAEAGIDLTADLAFSILKILNSDRPPQLGLRYRINENTRLRGYSNFNDDSRAIIEYQRRF